MRINHNQFNINFAESFSPSGLKITKGEFFAGGGGFTEGAKQVPDIETRWILNHDKTALRANAFHNKGVKVFWADIYVQDERELEPVDYVHGSIECDWHSKANSGKAKKLGSYTMGWEFYRYLSHLNPLVISIENVPEFKKWGLLDENNEPIKETEGQEFDRWVNAIKALGYEYTESIRNAADDGLPTRRVRLFCFFYRPGIDISFPEATHSENGDNGTEKWQSCREHIDTEDLGISVFGREYNEALPKHLRKKLCKNSMRRIAGGIRKQYPGLYQFLAKYHAGDNPERTQSLDKPINVIDTSNRHQLVTYEKWQFIMDHCHTDNYNSLDDPINPVLTRQTKQFANIQFFIAQYYGGSIQSNNLDEPINTIPCRDTHQLVRVEKLQFIAKYFNSDGHPESQTQNLNDPLSSVLGTNKHQLVTLLDDFDIKVRFLRADELAACSTFPKNYFSHPELKLSQKVAVQLIGNAVPPKWATVLLSHNIENIKSYKMQRLSA